MIRWFALAASFACLATAGAAEAGGGSVATATFSVSTLSMGTSTLSMGTSPVFLPTSSVEFPTSLQQIETASTIEVTLPADILFDFDKADIRPSAQAVLTELARIIRDKARGTVKLQGHTDGLGSEAYNQKLSERRAASIKAWLVHRGGLVASALSTAGFGARAPVAPNRRPDGSDDPDGRQLNRRVTAVIPKL